MHRILWSVSLALALLGNGCAQAALPKDAPAPVKTVTARIERKCLIRKAARTGKVHRQRL